jgi:dihydrofolate synthase/folylpolyglutamate synthase
MPSLKTPKLKKAGKTKPVSPLKTVNKTPTPTAVTARKVVAKSATTDITNYSSALRWLYSHTDHERLRVVQYNNKNFSLDRMKKLLDLLGNPHQQIKCVQIAGTKGKGSTSAMLASMLQACGYATGLYTSPHMVDLRERITINGQMIGHGDMTDVLKLIASKIGPLADNPPSFFEVMTAACLRYFADQAVDIAVLETGLGGRLDAVTACTPLVCGLTQISYDHMNVLGKDLPSIAREKAGILKKGVPAISVDQESAVTKVFEEVAASVGTTVEFTGKQVDFSYRFEANRELGPHTRVCLTTPASRWEHLAVPLRGEHQALNCGLALAMLDKLKAHGFNIPDDKVVSGLASTKIAGRMEQVWTEPRVIVDGAHNAASIQALIRALGAHVAYDSLVLVFGCAQDKDITGMLKQIALGADKVIFTRARNNPRATEPEELWAKFNDLSGKMAQTAASLEEAVRLANRAVSREDLIVVTGSFYLVGEAKKHFAEMTTKKRFIAR